MNRLKTLTPRQRQVFEFVQACTEETGSAPTLEEICSHFGFKSPNAARQHLKLIAQKGYLKLSPGRARGIRLTTESVPTRSIAFVPLAGRIAAGEPIVAIEDVEATIPVPRELWRGNDLFALRVQGDSMTGAGIFDGDIAIVNAQPLASNGDIAAVVIGEDVTLKRFFRSSEGIRLRAENSNYSDLYFNRSDTDAVRIAGVLVGTLRTF